MAIKIPIGEDHAVVRQALEYLLDDRELMTDASAAERSAVDPRDLGLHTLDMDALVIVNSDYRLVYASPAACEMLRCTFDQLRKCDFSTSIPERVAACPGAEPVRWTVVIPGPDDSELDVECTATSLDFGGEQLIGIRVQDVSERRRQAREAAALAQEAARIATSHGIEATLQALAEGALSGTRALGAAVWLDYEDERAVWIGAAGLPDRFREGLRASMAALRCVAADQTPAAWRRVVAYHDARKRLESNPAWWGGLTEGLEPLRWQAAVFAPLIYLRGTVGMLMAVYATDTVPSEEEATFLATLADQAALAAVNGRLIAAGQERPAPEDRQPLAARELHDSVSQALYGIALGARTACDLLERDPARLSQTIDYILQLAAVGLAALRASTFEVRPESLETEGLVTALNSLIEAVQVRYGIAADPILCAEPDAPLAVKQALYRIALGAFRNVVKHAHAGRVDVRLEAQRGKVVLEVEDHGVGFEPDGTFSRNPGLRQMRDRARGVGGSFEVVSAPGRRTRIRVCVPSRPILRGISLVNGVHDMGGSHGHGAIEIEPSDPVFHTDWERKVWAMMRVCLRQGLFNTDEMRHAIERMEPARYLGASYYERWLIAMETLVREKGVVGEGPIRPSGRNPTCEVPPTPRFKPGDRVRTRDLNRHGHTRLPGYARYRRGVIEQVYAPALLPDTNVGPKSRDWQPVYLVRFDSRELWGEQGHDRETVSSSLFESYLEPEAS